MTKDNEDLLIEIGTEELPPTALKRLSNAFSEELTTRLAAANLEYGRYRSYATPRRLAVHIEQVSLVQPDRVIDRRGPALSAAFDADGQPTKAAQGFARSVGLDVDKLDRIETDKGAWLCAHFEEKGRATAELVPELIEASLEKLPVSKRMRWGVGSEEFVRPVRWVVILLGEAVIKTSILGVESDQKTRGHRAHHPDPIPVSKPQQYAGLLENKGYVCPDFNRRQAKIRDQVMQLATELGGTALLDQQLLDEVTSLVEWPVALTGSFDSRFLQVPHEALITTMMGNQRYFPVQDETGHLMPHFITVANLESHDPEQVRLGNERVIRPRLHDAEFFWLKDQRRPLIDRRESLKTILFQKQLGSLYDKSERLAELASAIAADLGTDARLGRRAGVLSKCDLATSMVFEFPELQGIMGRHYAIHDGEDPSVAQALEDQYRPVHAGDVLPEGAIGQALALAEKLDTLIGIFALGQRPSGAKDPFALRRSALGVVRILIESCLDLDLWRLLRLTAENLSGRVDTTASVTEVFNYVMERLSAYYADRGIPEDAVDAVLACQPSSLVDLDRRVRAVQQFRVLPEAEALSAANKRIRNILRQVSHPTNSVVNKTLLVEPAEIALFEKVQKAESDTSHILANENDYSAVLARLAGLRDSIDLFFNETLVMCEDEKLRHNRVALLMSLSTLFLQVADISRLQSAGNP